MSLLPPGEFAAEVTANQTDFTTPGDDFPSKQKTVVGRSPGSLAWDRFRSDRKTVAGAIVVAIYVVLAILAPILVAAGVLDPYTVNQNLINDSALPIGPFGGISAQHPLGVEPGIGRDTLSRVWLGLTLLLLISALRTGAPWISLAMAAGLPFTVTSSGADGSGSAFAIRDRTNSGSSRPAASSACFITR